jgi:CubicO group peptidase (beta-lactamase class C family)
VDLVDTHDAELARRLDDLVAAGRTPGLHGLVVLRRGQVVLEHYATGRDYAWGTDLGTITFDRQTLHDVRSVTKSITALLYGIALDRGLVPGPQAPLLAAFPEYADLASDPARQALRIEHVLTMTLGLDWDETVPYTSPANSEIAMELAPDRFRYILERPIVEPPGQRWRYCGGASALLGRLIVKGAEQTLPDFATEALFRPLGITSFGWLAGGDGVHSPASGLRLGPRDLARIGQVVLAGGAWHGQQVIPSAWLEAMLRPRVEIAPNFAYGYQWYLLSHLGPSGAWRAQAAQGNGDQRLLIIPDADLVVALTAGNYDTPRQGELPRTVLADLILPSLS